MHVKSLPKVPGIRKLLRKHKGKTIAVKPIAILFFFLSIKPSLFTTNNQAQFTKRCLKLKTLFGQSRSFHLNMKYSEIEIVAKNESIVYFNLLAETWPNLVKM